MQIDLSIYELIVLNTKTLFIIKKNRRTMTIKYKFYISIKNKVKKNAFKKSNCNYIYIIL